MNVRAITGFFDPGWPVDPERLGSMAEALQACRQAIEVAGYETQTLRLATPPPSEMENPVSPPQRPDLAVKLEAECFVHGIDYAAIGPALPYEPAGYTVIPDILGASEIVFSSGMLADPESGLSFHAALACGQVMHTAATLSDDGFTNLRFAALANVGSGAPFFPAAYHQGGPPGIAVATEAAAEAVDVIASSDSLENARRHLLERIEDQANALARALEPVCQAHGVRFLGVDYSFAPFPEKLRSLGTAFIELGIPGFGAAGSAMATAFLADTLDRASFPRTGFCGLFFPVLEDAILAQQSIDGPLTINDLLLYSTLCGTGLDTVPLPGDISADAMAAILLDLGALALRHNKPLTARLMPIPGKKAGEPVHYDFPYFADGKVLAVNADELTGLLEKASTIDISPHPIFR
jgi:uncharacterized protein (UPF0210 family)